jgi:hypothetical protein
MNSANEIFFDNSSLIFIKPLPLGKRIAPLPFCCLSLNYQSTWFPKSVEL